MDKTNVMRVLDSKKVQYTSHEYEPDATMTGEEIAGILGEDPSKVFKTLVTQGKSGSYYVFVVPVKEELDLKKAAKLAGCKSVNMIHVKDLLNVTGYIRGGCSPIGMKKQYRTFIDEMVELVDDICVSAGQRGVQLRLKSKDLISFTNAVVGDFAMRQ